MSWNGNIWISYEYGAELVRKGDGHEAIDYFMKEAETGH